MNPVEYLEQVKAAQGARVSASVRAASRAPLEEAARVVRRHPIAASLVSGMAGFCLARWRRWRCRAEAARECRVSTPSSEPVQAESPRPLAEWKRQALSLLPTALGYALRRTVSEARASGDPADARAHPPG